MHSFGYSKLITKRSFPCWSMTYRELKKGESREIKNYFEVLG